MGCTFNVTVLAFTSPMSMGTSTSASSVLNHTHQRVNIPFDGGSAAVSATCVYEKDNYVTTGVQKTIFERRAGETIARKAVSLYVQERRCLGNRKSRELWRTST